MIRGRAEIFVNSLVYHQSFNHHPQGSICNVSPNDKEGSMNLNNIEVT